MKSKLKFSSLLHAYLLPSQRMSFVAPPSPAPAASGGGVAGGAATAVTATDSAAPSVALHDSDADAAVTEDGGGRIPVPPSVDGAVAHGYPFPNALRMPVTYRAGHLDDDLMAYLLESEAFTCPPEEVQGGGAATTTFLVVFPGHRTDGGVRAPLPHAAVFYKQELRVLSYYDRGLCVARGWVVWDRWASLHPPHRAIFVNFALV